MFSYIAESITYLLIKYKKLDIEHRELYLYGFEAILLNGTLIVLFLIISLGMHMMVHFIGFLIIFVPLRIFAGGYHAKSSGICFIMSIATYVLTMLIVKYNLGLYKDARIFIGTLLALIIAGIGGPIKNPQHPLSNYQFKRNKKILLGIVTFDFALFIFFDYCDLTIATSISVFVLTTFIMWLTANIQLLCKERQKLTDTRLVNMKEK